MKKVLLWGAAIVGVLVVVCCVASLLAPTEWNVRTSVVIDAPPERIHAYVNRPRVWVQFAERHAAVVEPETEMTFTFSDIEEGVGAWYVSEAPGSKVHIEYTASDPAKGIEYQGRIETDEVNDHGSITYEVVEGGTRVTWTDKGDVPTGFGLMTGVLEDHLTPFFTGILTELKTAVESGEQIPDLE